MKFLKMKFAAFSLLTVMAASVFLTSCEQKNVVNPEVPNDIQQVIERVIQDADVAEFINTSMEFDKAITERIEANQERFDAYLLTNDNDKISELIGFDDIVHLYEKMINSASIVSTKFPQISEIGEDDIEKFYLNNPQFIETSDSENQSMELESRCNGNFWNNLLFSWCMYSCSKNFPWSVNCSDLCFEQHCS